jgi:glycosyltransferase involved in cell wall biosynthesis
VPTRVALVFQSFGSPLHLHWVNWAQHMVAARELDAHVFAHHIDNDFALGVARLGRQGRVDRLRHLVSSALAMPRGIRFLWNKLHGSARTRVSHWLDFAPLIDFDPAVICLVHTQMYPRYEPLLGAMKAKLITSYRGYDVQVRPRADSAWVDTLRRIHDRSSRLHFVSHGMKRSYAALFPEAVEAKCRVIHGGVDTESFAPVIRPPADRPVVQLISTGRLVWEKGHILTLHAVRKLLDKGLNVRLVVIGEGGDRHHLTYWRQKLALERHVEFAGQQSREELRRRLVESDVFVQASLSEGLPNTVLEAAATALPVVATDVGGIPETTIDGVTGRLVPAGDADTLADALIPLVRDVSLRRRYGDAARAYVVEKFSMATRDDAWIRMIQEVAGE